MSRFDLTKEAYRKYPNDYRVIEKYIGELFNDPNYLEEPSGEEVHKDELFRLCENVLEMSGSRAVWPEVLSVYAVKTAGDPNNPQEVASMDESKKQILKDVFWL